MGTKLILTDIDRTILPHGAERVSPGTVAAFHAALDAGIHVGPASGRGYGWIPPFFGGDEECCKTCVATNGNQVFLDGRRLREARFDGDVLAPVVSHLRGIPGSGLIAFDGDVPTLVAGRLEDLAVVFPAYARACRTAPDGGPLGLPDFPATKANAFLARDGRRPGDDETKAFVDGLNQAVEGLDFDFPEPGFTNVMRAGWNKASGIDCLADALGISLDEVVVFGDAGNDLSMFARVPNSFAVANATEEAARAARWHIGACEDDAVAQAIEALAAGEWPFRE